MTLLGQISASVLCHASLLAVGRSSANNGNRWTVGGRAGGRQHDQSIHVLSRTVQSALQHPSSGPPQKFADRGALGRSTIDAASGHPRSPGLHCSIGGFLVHMSGRLKFKSKSCHGTAARPVTAHLQQGCTAPERRGSLFFFLTALRPRYPSSVTGHGPLPPLRPVMMARLRRRQISNASRGG